MNIKSLARKFAAFSMLAVLGVSSVSAARPMKEFNLFDEPKQEVKKLPPVHYVRSRDFDLQHVALKLKFDWEKEQTYGTATLTLAPLMPNFQTLNLDAGAMTINSVKLNGADLKFAYDEANTNLSVTLDRVYKIGETLTLTVDYRTKGVVVANTLGFGAGGGLKFIKPDADNPVRRRQIWSQGETDYNRFWFPSYDSPNDFRTSELTATVEKPMFVVSNGKLIERRDNKDGTETFHWKMDTPYANYLTSIVVGEYAEIKGNYQGIPVITYLYPNESKEGAASVEKLPEMVKFFSELTGVKYPYVKYAQTMAEGFGGGMENITATTMTPTMIHDRRTLLDFDSESLQSHELAHQWFGNYVTCREWSEIWLNESFATYMQALWDEHSKGRDYFLYSDVRGNQNQYFQAWNQGSRRPIVTKYYPNADALFDSYAYPRGGAVLHMLRKHLGDEMFFKAINRYLTKHANQPVQTEQLRIAIEEATGQSMDWFFDQWLYKMGHPIFEITQDYDAAAKKLTLKVKQTQKIDPLNEYPQAQYFQARVDVEIDDRIEQVWLKPEAENVFTFDAPEKPKLVNFDYEGTLIKEVRFAKTTDELVYQMKNDKDVLGRVWALNELAGRYRSDKTDIMTKSGITTALQQTIATDAFWAIRRDAIQIIGAPKGNPNDPTVSFTDSTKAVLNNAKADKNSQVRAAAILALGLTKDAKYAPGYLAALTDQSYGVIDAAAIALARTNDAAAYASLVKLTETESWKSRLRLAGLNGLATLGDQRAVELAFKFADKSNPANVRAAALNVLAASGKGDARIYPLLIESFKKSLENNDFQGIFSGFQGIVRLADPRGQEAFDLAKEKFKGQNNILNYVNMLETQFKKAIEQK
jgi:aminopeptidase N